MFSSCCKKNYLHVHYARMRHFNCHMTDCVHSSKTHYFLIASPAEDKDPSDTNMNKKHIVANEVVYKLTMSL